jgi:hypothetical protein
METDLRAKKVIAHQVLSENQCGMETRRAIVGQTPINNVEREPMWDGNATGCRAPDGQRSQLSENQCGMETSFLLSSHQAFHALSENQCGMETMITVPAAFVELNVEREPMWDGN